MTEFLIRVEPDAEGYEASCSEVVEVAEEMWILREGGQPAKGRGSTEMSAMVSAVANSRLPEITREQAQRAVELRDLYKQGAYDPMGGEG